MTNGPGLLGLGGAIGVIPLGRLDLHDVYNGLEMILIVLGFWNETEAPTYKRRGVVDESDIQTAPVPAQWKHYQTYASM